MSGPGEAGENEQYVDSATAEANWLFEQFNVRIDHAQNELFDKHSPDVSDEVLVGRLLEESSPYASRFASLEAISECRGRFLSHFKDELADPSVQAQGEFVGVFDCESVIGEAIEAFSWQDDIPETRILECRQVAFSMSWDANDGHWTEKNGHPVSASKQQRTATTITPKTIISEFPFISDWNNAPSRFPDGIVYAGTAFRAVSTNHSTTAWDIHADNVAANHRYSRPGKGALYAGTSQEAILAELNHYGIDPTAVAWVSKEVKLGNVLDLTNESIRQQYGVSLEDLTGDSYRMTQAIGDFACQRYDGLLVPSAREPGATIVVIFAKGN